MDRAAPAPDPEVPTSRWSVLAAAIDALTVAASLAEIIEIIRGSARQVAGADGVCVVLDQGEECVCVAEDAVGPLWTGRRFPKSTCISGLAIQEARAINIPDIMIDPRVPQDIYRGTFVRSLIMTPVGVGAPTAAIGAYWARVAGAGPDAAPMLDLLARASAAALARVDLVAALTSSRAQLSAVLESVSDCFYAVDEEWRMVVFNGAAERYFRLARSDVIGRSIWELFPQGVGTPYEFTLRAAMTDQTSTVVETSSVLRPGRMLEFRVFPMDGGGVSVSISDITDRKDAEAALKDRVAEAVADRERALSQLHEAQKIETIGHLTGGVAHDFNNLLSPIIGSLDLLQRRGVGDEKAKALISGARDAADRAKLLVQRLLAFARRQPLRAAPVSVHDTLDGMKELLAATLGPKVAITVEAPADFPAVLADRNQLELALLNLAVNSRDAMRDGGAFTVRLQRRRVDAEGAGMARGEYAGLVVADDGCGMDAETARRAIEPFFSTKGVGEGTGLGLSMVHGLVAQLGGALEIESAPNEGARITLWLPLAETAPRQQRASVTPAETGSGRALVIDDDPLVRAVTADMMETLGYLVLEAASAEAAMGLLDAGTAVDLIVTDHLMPGMSGADFARALRATRPGLPVLLVSGYAQVEQIAVDLPRLSKPFSVSELAAALAGVRAM